MKERHAMRGDTVNGNCTAIIFDLDGTLVDSSPGILHCHAETLARLGLPVPEKSVLAGAIGSPLPAAFRGFGLDAGQIDLAVPIYRSIYADAGIDMAEAYPGTPEVLDAMREGGFALGVATLKLEAFALRMLERLGLDRFLGFVHGMDAADTRTKSDAIRCGIAAAGVPAEQVLVVGDNAYDAEGAHECGAGFAAALYGYGLWDRQTLERWNPAFTIRDIRDLPGILHARRHSSGGASAGSNS